MKTFSINIAKAYTLSDWQGQPAHSFMARLHLDAGTSQAGAEVELHRLTTVYPFPDYHLSLHSEETVRTSQTVLSAAPRDFLDGKLWDYPSTHD
jgi:hypothetical protein